MKQIELTRFSKTTNGVRIFRDDIEYFLNLLERKGLEIIISDDSYIYESIEELKQTKGNNRLTFKINGVKKKEIFQRDDVTISFKDNSASIYSYGSEEMRSFGFELSAILESKSKWHYKVFRPTLWGLLSTWMFGPVLITFNEYTNTSIVKFLFIIEAILVAFLLFSLFLRNSSYGVTLARKHEFGFWVRNKDNIILAIVAALFGSLITVFFNWMQS